MRGDFFERGFGYFVFGVVEEARADLAGYCPAGPGAPFALVGTRLAESVSIVLEVHGVLEYACESGVGQWPIGQDWFVSFEVCTPGSV